MNSLTILSKSIVSNRYRLVDYFKYVVGTTIWMIRPSTFLSEHIGPRRVRILAENRIDIVLDVGAHVGSYGLELRRAGYTGHIVSFEPLTLAYGSLATSASKDPKWMSVQTALGEYDGSAVLNISGNLYSSSLLPMCEVHVESQPVSAYVGEEVVKVSRLDDTCSAFLRGDERIWLKLDVQGYERQVIDGATRILPQIQVIEAELSLVPLYEGQSLFREMIDFLDSLGFDLISLERGYTDRLSGHVLQVDGIFLRRTHGKTKV